MLFFITFEWIPSADWELNIRTNILVTNLANDDFEQPKRSYIYIVVVAQMKMINLISDILVDSRIFLALSHTQLVVVLIIALSIPITITEVIYLQEINQRQTNNSRTLLNCLVCITTTTRTATESYKYKWFFPRRQAKIIRAFIRFYIKCIINTCLELY